MKVLKYKVELQTDIILNQKAATEGANTTLDFIPGGCFLGVVAREIYKDNNEQNLTIFHSGKVRFGDAHPANGEVRTLRVPAMMMHPKLSKEEYYISAAIHPKDDAAQKELRELQLKQCRTGFYDFSQNPALEVEAETSFAIKSAYDKEKRTSREGKMYGYESLRKGLTLYFEVEVEDEALAETIGKALVGTKHIGRSRSAQYGLVEIQPYGFQAIDATKCPSKDEIYVYADGRLIFLDANGLPTFRPTAKDLGIGNGKIDWQKSQVRTFQYAPWNATRQCFDTDRCGIEKGSVLVVKCTGDTPTISPRYVGSYQNEGFGKVLYNPAFLEAAANDQYGKAVYQLKKKEKEEGQETTTAATATKAEETTLLKYLRLENEQAKITFDIYKYVKKWVDDYASSFASKEFASQWSTIRALASIRKAEKTVWNMLFEKEDGYLEHGIAKDKWDEGGRKKKLQEFINGLPENMDNEDVRLAVVNLAAEMAKRCRRKEEQK